MAIVLSLGVAVLNTMGMIKNYSKLSTSVIVYGIFFAIFMLLSCVGLIFLLNKRKSGLIICVASLVINFIYGTLVGASPLELIIILLPVIYSVMSMRDVIKDLKM